MIKLYKTNEKGVFMFYKLVELFSEIKIILKSVSGESSARGFLLISSVLALALVFTALVLEKDRFLRLAALSRGIKKEKYAPRNPAFSFLPSLPEPSEKAGEPDNILPKSTLDAAAADALISDKMAKNLIHRTRSVKVFGKKKRVVNLGELSRAFSDGERVDINRMKAVGLIPYDSLEIKVLASGELDKKLFILANGFSKTAVKMIALKGGEAVKVTSKRVKMPKEMDG